MRKKTDKEFKNEMFLKYGDEFTVLGEYTTAKVLISIRHNKCGNVWDVSPGSIRKKSMCPFCSHNKKRDTAQFKKEVYELVGDEYMVLGEYVNANTNILMKHNTCNHEFEMRPNDFVNNNQGCPKCRESYGEKKISKYLLTKGINIYPNTNLRNVEI